MDRSKWEYKKLGDCFAYIKNGANIKQVNGATGIPITRIETLSNDVFNRDRMGYANIDDVSPYSSNILNDGDILMSHINSMKFLGRAVEYKKNDEEVIIHGMNLLRMIPTSSFLSSYAVYQFKTDHFRKQIKAISHQAVNQASFNVTNLKGLNLIVPPVADQQRIVAELDCLNEMIALKQEQLKEFDKLAQSIFYDMFGDPVTNDKGWDVFLLSKFGKVTTGNTPSRKVPKYYDKDFIEWIKTDNIDKSEMYPSLAKEYLSESGAKLGRIVESGSLLITCIAGSLSSIGGVCITNRKVAFNQQINAITPNEKVDSVFLYYLIKTSGEYIRENATNGMKHIITKSSFENLELPLPPLALQQQFAEKIQAIEAQKELVKQSIAETQQLLDSRMDYYFD